MRFYGNPQRCRRPWRGQALVEFALVIPIFLTLVVGISEFSFLLTSKTGIAFASQNATQLAAELGDSAHADCLIIEQIEKDLQSPIDVSKVTAVSIFWTDLNGSNKAANTWTRAGSFLCPGNITIPYTQSASNYPEADRCNILSAVGCAPGHNSIDWVGVSITYQYSWITPLPGMIGLTGSAPLFVETHTSRMEPVQ
jgi:Flp pilus assembly protein TadG